MFEKSWSDTCILLSLCFVTANVFPLCQAVSKCILPLVKQFPNVSISVFCLFSNFKLVPNVSQAVSNCICKCILPLVHFIVNHRPCFHSRLPAAASVWQQTAVSIYMLIDYISSPLYFATSLLFGTIGFLAITRGCAQGRWGKKMEIGILRTANDVWASDSDSDSDQTVTMRQTLTTVGMTTLLAMQSQRSSINKYLHLSLTWHRRVKQKPSPTCHHKSTKTVSH